MIIAQHERRRITGLHYMYRAGTNRMLLLPFAFCGTVFLAAFLTAPYVCGLLDEDVGWKRTVRLALVLSFSRPLRAIVAAAVL